MNESYAEYLVRKKTPFYMYIITGILGLITLYMAVLAFTVGILEMILMFILGFATYLAYRNCCVEFEYLFIDNSLSVDKILGRSKRRKAYELSMADLQLMAPYGSHELDAYRNRGKILDFSSHTNYEKAYVAAVEKGGVLTLVILEPDERILKLFRQSAPSKTKV